MNLNLYIYIILYFHILLIWTKDIRLTLRNLIGRITFETLRSTFCNFCQIRMLIVFFLLQVNGNHETINVEGDFRYVESGAFEECADFLEYLNDYKHDWEEAFVRWCRMSKRWKGERRISRNNWGSWNLVKVLKVSVLSVY